MKCTTVDIFREKFKKLELSFENERFTNEIVATCGFRGGYR